MILQFVNGTTVYPIPASDKKATLMNTQLFTIQLYKKVVPSQFGCHSFEIFMMRKAYD